MMRADGLFDEGPTLTAVDFAHGFDKPNQYETIQTARIKRSKQVGRIKRSKQAARIKLSKQAVVLARAANGLHVYMFVGGQWHEQGSGLPDLSNANGFEKPSQYRTIRTGVLTQYGSFDVVARTAAGIVAWTLDIPTLRWTKLSTGPTLTGPLWEDPSHYDTIRLADIRGTGRSALVVRGVYGVRTFVWEDGSFRRPRPYGDFPGFHGKEAAAYAEVANLLLGHAGNFRKETYASPTGEITEATLLGYERRLSERCTPVSASVALGGPPRYKDCKPPPGSNVDAAAWTAVSNQIIDELWAATGVAAHFKILSDIETELFQDQQGSFPPLHEELKLPPNPPDKSPTFVKLIKSGLEILVDIAQLLPDAGAPKVLRSIALTAHALGAVADGLGLSSAPSPAQPYAKITAEIAKLQQRERDIIQAQRRYILADYGLLTVIGSEEKGRLLTLDKTAALSAGRQSFGVWVTKLYVPAYWNRYRVSKCIKKTFFRKVFDCVVPNGPYVTVTRRDNGFTDFNAVLANQTNCHELFNGRKCDFHSPEGPNSLFSRIVSAISSQCRYDGIAGSTNAWRYGCSLGAPASDLIDGKAGWDFALFDCTAYPDRTGSPPCRRASLKTFSSSG
jgi:hypothetical protein